MMFTVISVEDVAVEDEEDKYEKGGYSPRLVPYEDIDEVVVVTSLQCMWQFHSIVYTVLARNFSQPAKLEIYGPAH